MDGCESLKCDRCGLFYGEVLILRRVNFTERASKIELEKLHRVCWDCARWLARHHHYRFGYYWRGILLGEVFTIDA